MGAGVWESHCSPVRTRQHLETILEILPHFKQVIFVLVSIFILPLPEAGDLGKLPVAQRRLSAQGHS